MNKAHAGKVDTYRPRFLLPACNYSYFTIIVVKKYLVYEVKINGHRPMPVIR